MRKKAYDVIGEEYVFIQPYLVGHTLEGKLIVVVDIQVKGGCHIVDDEAKIDGSAKGHWYAVLCPSRRLPNWRPISKPKRGAEQLFPKCISWEIRIPELTHQN